MNAVKITLLLCLVVAALGFLGGLLFHYPDWRGVGAMTIVGGFLGIMAAPELNPSAFGCGRLIQLIAGAIAGSTIAWMGSDGAVLYVIIGALAGGIAGITAPFWLKYVSFP